MLQISDILNVLVNTASDTKWLHTVAAHGNVTIVFFILVVDVPLSNTSGESPVRQPLEPCCSESVVLFVQAGRLTHCPQYTLDCWGPLWLVDFEIVGCDEGSGPPCLGLSCILSELRDHLFSVLGALCSGR